MTTDLIIAPAAPAPLLPMEPEQAALMMDRYRELCESILTPDDVIGIPGTPGGFVKRSGFSKLATFYSVSTFIAAQEMDRDDTDEDWPGKPLRARARVRATAANGRYAEGDGACAITEPRFRGGKGQQKAEHDIMATAVTRATNRAISNLIGFGSVSAEEADAAEPERPYGEAANRGEEDGLLRALEDLGADARPAQRVIEKAGGYLPRIAALAVMYAAASVRDIKTARETRGEDITAFATTASTLDADVARATAAPAEPKDEDETAKDEEPPDSTEPE